jgi:hypothetical protein
MGVKAIFFSRIMLKKESKRLAEKLSGRHQKRSKNWSIPPTTSSVQALPFDLNWQLSQLRIVISSSKYVILPPLSRPSGQ